MTIRPEQDKLNNKYARKFAPSVMVFLLAMSSYLAWLAHSYLLFPEFSENLYNENVKRHVQGIDPAHRANVSFYIEVLYRNFSIWLLAVPVTAYTAFATRITAPGILIARLLFCWTAVVLIAVSLSVSKLAWYAYPAFASLSILIALGVRQAIAAARQVTPHWVANIALPLLLTVPAAATFRAAFDSVREPPQIAELHALNILAKQHKEVQVISVLPDPLSPLESGHRKQMSKAFYIKTLAGTQGTDISLASGCQVLISDEDRFQSEEGSDDSSVLIVERWAEWERNIALVDSCAGRTLQAIWRANEPLLHGSAMIEGIDFSRPGFPSDVIRISGLGKYEAWGRWSVANRVVLDFDRPLPVRFDLSLRIITFGPNRGRDVKVRVGQVERSFAGGREVGTYVLRFENVDGAKSIRLEIPHPTAPSKLGLGADSRRLGIGFIKMGIAPVE